MIDNYAKTMELIEKIKSCLPIPAYPTPTFISLMKGKKIKIASDKHIQIESVLYLGDAGGIGCGIKMQEVSKEAVVTSLTHLRIPPDHPLAREIVDYQKRRMKKLRKQGNY